MAVVDGDAVDPTTYSLMGPTGLRVRRNPLGSLVMGIEDVVGSGTYWLVSSTQYKTTGQSLQIALAPNQTPRAPVLDDAGILKTVGYLHCDSGFTVGVFCAVYANKIELGTFTRTSPSSSGPTLPATIPATFGGSDGFTYTVAKTWDATQAIPTSARIEVKNVGTLFSVLLDDLIVIDSQTVAATLNATTRNNAAVSLQRASFGDDQKQDSPWLSGFAVSDYIPQTLMGSGAKMARTTGTAVAGAATGGVSVLFPTNFFTTTIRATTDITCTPSTGRFTVTVEGWYDVKLFFINGAVIPASGLIVSLFKNGTVYEMGGYLAAGAGIGAPSMSWTIYLNSGDYVQPAYQLGTATANLFAGGTSIGERQYFTITLANRSIG